MKKCLIILSIIALVVQCAVLTGQRATEGSMEFSVTTKETGERFSPQHVLTIWVTDKEGNFVKTLKVNGVRYKRFLLSWIANSQQNEVDAISGATLKSHQTHTVMWDCRDAAGTVVADGDYQIHVEFTEKNGQGPVTPEGHIQFKKGNKSVSLTPEDLTYFYDMQLRYTP